MRIVAFDQGRIVLSMLVVLLLVPWSAHAARTIQVPGDVATVQGAIAAAVDRDTVLLGDRPRAGVEIPVNSGALSLDDRGLGRRQGRGFTKRMGNVPAE
jgi:hypothetical protein